jgi:hypothetical protein
MQQILHKTWPPKDITAGQHLYMTDLHSIYGQYLRQKPKTHVINQLLFFITRLFDDGFVEESFTATYLCEWESWAFLYHLGS